MIKILVDSAADCRKSDSFYDGIVPISVALGGREYADSVDLDADTFYRLLTTGKDFPKTAQPAPQSFLEHFEKAKADGDEIIYFALSSALSGTLQSATIAKNMVDYDGIYLIDSKTATHAIGMLARHAADLAAQGLPAKEIAAQCEALKSRVKILAGLDTLEYLHRGGRLSKASAMVGELTGIKPVITVTPEGTVSAIGKSMGRAGAMQFIAKQLAALEPDDSFPMYSLYTWGEENCSQLEDNLKARGYHLADRLQVGASIGAHVGPGVYGVLFVAK